MVTYSNEKKSDFLGIDEKLIEEYGAVSSEVAIEMAKGIRKVAQTHIGVGVTGIAGPTGGSANKPVGLVFIAVTDGKKIVVEEKNAGGKFNDRIKIKNRTAIYMLDSVRRFIINNC
jgi:nicotinamide-nucleotide amidase